VGPSPFALSLDAGHARWQPTDALSLMKGRVAAVVIGRNEGERLRRCVESLAAQVQHLVYVDSGSTDGSVALAQARGAQVVALDLSIPFTAARARNAGLAWLTAHALAVDFVQFVDGDCEVQPGWLEAAVEHLDAHPQTVAVCGRRRERFAQHSLYNALCDDEWNMPVGEVRACGGDVMMRLPALAAVGGYREEMIAGEEPELCVRLRARRGVIEVLPVEMTLHDAAITHLRQWWLRTVRAGHAYAQGASLHGAPPEWHCVRPLCRALAWGVFLPVAALLGAAFFSPTALWLLAAYPVQWFRLAWRERGDLRRRAAAAALLLLGKFAESQGAWRFLKTRLLRRSARLIEYK
jgi:GT2 family glycosyltransferase